MPEYARNRLHLFLVIVASVLTAPASMAAENDENPNIVFILMDNFGWGEIGVYGGGELRGAPTPSIDSIAHEGLRLTNYNVEAECVPSRASMMTGRYGIRTRQRHDGPPRGTWYGITKWEETLAEVLSHAGYTTALFGKWHLGDTEGRFPTDQGFDEWIGIAHSSDRAFWPDSNSYNPDAHPDAVFTRIMRSKRGETPTEHEVFDREITDQSISSSAKPTAINRSSSSFPTRKLTSRSIRTPTITARPVMAALPTFSRKLTTTSARYWQRSITWT